MTYIDTRWASQDRVALEAAVAALAEDPNVAAVAPLRSAAVAGVLLHFALIRSLEPLAAPAAPVTVDEAGLGTAVTGVFAAGPDRRADPRDWMDRIPREKQLAIIAAGQADAAVNLLLLRIVSGLVNPEAAETIAGVQAMRAAGLIDDADVQALLF